MANDTFANFFGSDLMYRRYAKLFQRPRVWIAESGRPAEVAVVAAPIQKLFEHQSVS